MEAAHGSRMQNERIALGRLLWAGLLAGVAAVAANVAVYLVASAFGTITESIVQSQAPLALGAVVFSSFVPALAGALLFALLGWSTRRPVRNFRVFASIVLVLSFATPFMSPGAPLAMVATLLLMHVVAAVAVVSILTTLAHAKYIGLDGTFRACGYGTRLSWGRYSVFVRYGIDSGANPYSADSLGNSRRKESCG